jgi:hypothetical protein
MWLSRSSASSISSTSASGTASSSADRPSVTGRTRWNRFQSVSGCRAAINFSTCRLDRPIAMRTSSASSRYGARTASADIDISPAASESMTAGWTSATFTAADRLYATSREHPSH